MLKQLFIMVVLVAILIGCGAKAAVDFSNTIVEKEKSLEPGIRSTEANVTSYIQAGNYDSVAAAGENMEKKVQKKIDEIDALALPDAKGASDFKAAALVYFQHIKNVYTIYKNLGQAETEEKRQEIMNDLQTLVAKNTMVTTAFQAAQRRYADANGFKLK